MAFALVYTSEHYFSDVLAGWLYAAAAFLAVEVVAPAARAGPCMSSRSSVSRSPALASLTIAGGRGDAALSPRFPRDAQAALAPVVGAALVATASVLVPLGVPARPLAVGVGVLGARGDVAYARRAVAVLRAGAAPLAIAVCAVALAGAPSLARGDWGRRACTAARTRTTGRRRLARTSTAGAAARIRSTRIACPTSGRRRRAGRSRCRSARCMLAWVSGNDPSAVYSAIAAVVFALLPLVGFACARGCFDWRGRWAFARGAVPARRRRAPVREPLLVAAAARRYGVRVRRRDGACGWRSSPVPRAVSPCSRACLRLPRSRATGSASRRTSSP